MQVAATTLALLSTSCAASSSSSMACCTSPNASLPALPAAWRLSAAACAPAGEAVTRASRLTPRSAADILAGCPTRTTSTPNATSPATKLSTATLDAAVASTGDPLGSTHTAAATRRSSVRVLPVPGGPCHSVSVRPSASCTALACERLSPPPRAAAAAALFATSVLLATVAGCAAGAATLLSAASSLPGLRICCSQRCCSCSRGRGKVTGRPADSAVAALRASTRRLRPTGVLRAQGGGADAAAS
mmetsp:Transcript_9839/g.24543  ORF Transcript_9839/g.24543 Transcript_9839/m.24543 type:complete len:246 (-) Transcript_9839:743-1480(-)